MTARRRFFSKVAALATLASGTFFVTACERQADEEDNRTTSSIDDRRQQLGAFVDTIVPRDTDPGAVEAGIPDELFAQLDKKEGEKKRVFEMLNTIDRFANKHFNAGFKTLSLDQREKVLDLVNRSRNKIDQPARESIFRLRARIIRAFYLSPTGWAMLAYSAPFPGGYPDFSNPPA